MDSFVFQRLKVHSSKCTIGIHYNNVTFMMNILIYAQIWYPKKVRTHFDKERKDLKFY